MFQCKDLLSLTTMSQASVIAGSGGMEKGIRWSYKAENINFEKWVRGNELLIVSAPVTQRKNFDLYQTIKKAIELNMSCALLLMGENYVTQIDEKVIDLAENNDFLCNRDVEVARYALVLLKLQTGPLALVDKSCQILLYFLKHAGVSALYLRVVDGYLGVKLLCTHLGYAHPSH